MTEHIHIYKGKYGDRKVLQLNDAFPPNSYLKS